MKSAAKLGVIGQVRSAMGNPVALFLGALFGGFVPVGSHHLAHYEARGFDIAALLVVGGLIYSAKTVYQWGKLAFECPWKAIGFVVLVEGIMVASKTPWLSFAALAYLVVINAMATGCQLALRDMPAEVKPKAVKQPKAVAPIVVEASKAVPAKPKRVRRSPARDTIPAPALEVSGEYEVDAA